MFRSIRRSIVGVVTVVAVSMSLAVSAVAQHSSGHNHNNHSHGDVNWTFHNHYTIQGRHWMEWHWFNTTTGEFGDYSRSFCVSFPCVNFVD